MKRPAIDQLVFQTMIPRPKATDPHSFNDLLQRFLVFEVRQEVHSFYGHLDTQEAKYPGLDYSNQTHRIRLSRWPWHRRLFRAFDHLRLTRAEIAHLTKWEGTRWAKERYEKEQNISIHDTAADDMPNFTLLGSQLADTSYVVDYASLVWDSHPTPSYGGHGEPSSGVIGQAPTSSLRSSQTARADADETMNDVDESHVTPTAQRLPAREGDDACDDSDDGVTRSIGIQLNEQLRERVAAHNAGDTSQPLDEDWEQWLKSVIEAGHLNMVAQHIGGLADLPFVYSPYSARMAPTSGAPAANAAPSSPSPVPSQILHAARQGNWDEVPEFLHDILRQTLEMEESQVAHTPPTAPSDMTAAAAAPIAPLSASPSASRSQRMHAQSPGWRRTFSTLRLPAGDASNTHPSVF